MFVKLTRNIEELYLIRHIKQLCSEIRKLLYCKWLREQNPVIICSDDHHETFKK